MPDKVFTVDAAADVAHRFRELELELEPTSADYFKLTVHPVVFVGLRDGNFATTDTAPHRERQQVHDGLTQFCPPQSERRPGTPT
jgi:hypothetical protein